MEKLREELESLLVMHSLNSNKDYLIEQYDDRLSLYVKIHKSIPGHEFLKDGILDIYMKEENYEIIVSNKKWKNTFSFKNYVSKEVELQDLKEILIQVMECVG